MLILINQYQYVYPFLIHYCFYFFRKKYADIVFFQLFVEWANQKQQCNSVHPFYIESASWRINKAKRNIPQHTQEHTRTHTNYVQQNDVYVPPSCEIWQKYFNANTIFSYVYVYVLAGCAVWCYVMLCLCMRCLALADILFSSCANSTTGVLLAFTIGNMYT